MSPNCFSILLISGLFFVSTTLSGQVDDNPFLRMDRDGRLMLTVRGASHFAGLALDCIQREYPNKLNQVLQDSSALGEPGVLHPAFYGCFDWHSSVHGHWMLVRLLHLFPDLPERDRIRAKLNENLSAHNIAGEVTYLKSASKSWERMYGWSWLLKLSEELFLWDDADARRWYENLRPLTEGIVQRYLDFLPVQQYPVRTGVHPNTAFGLSFAWDFARSTDHQQLKSLIEKRAAEYFWRDTDCPCDWEPSGEDFLSPCLEEANLMRRIMPKAAFNIWFKKFLPKKKLETLLAPATVSDRSDPKIVHLDGLNLSRAWCMYGITSVVKSVRLRTQLTKAAKQHLSGTLPHIASKYYEGSHWLASFAVLALSINEQ